MNEGQECTEEADGSQGRDVSTSEEEEDRADRENGCSNSDVKEEEVIW